MQTPTQPPVKKTLRNLVAGEYSQMTLVRVPATPHLQRLGYGTGVEVMRMNRSPKIQGVLQSPWAIKRLNKNVIDNYKECYEDRLLKEADLLKKLNHPNIVGFRNLIVDKDGRKCLAMEDGHTSLGDILEERYVDDMGPLPIKNVLKVALDMASALNYLHFEAKLLHGDLKSFNILIKGDFDTCKLCDFGVSVLIDDEGFIDTKNYPKSKFIGTDLWSAPETFESDPSIVSTKSEMFSYGLVIFETITLAPPHSAEISCHDLHDTKGTNDSVVCVDDSVISIKDSEDESSMVDEDVENSFTQFYGTRPSLPDSNLPKDYDEILGLFFICTNAEPDERPSAMEALNYVKSIIKKEQTEK